MSTLATMAPVICHGRTVWDRRALPTDEYEERREIVEKLVAKAGCAAAVGFDSGSSPGLAAYLTGHRSAGGLVTAVLVPGAPVVLLAGLGGGRDHPFIKATSFVDDVRWYPTPGEGVRAVLAEHDLSGPVGTAGGEDCLPADALLGFAEALAGVELRPLDGAVESLRRAKRPRELAVMRRAAALLDGGRRTVAAELARGASLHGGLVSGELALRLAGCRDVRLLASAADGSLRPWPWGGELAAPEQATVVLAAEYLGYWGEVAFVSTGADTAPAALLGELCAAIGPGVGQADLERAAAGLAGAVEVCGTGFELSESPVLAAGATVREGDVLAVRLWGDDGGRTLATCRVVVNDSGAVLLGAAPPHEELLGGALAARRGGAAR